jgi:hypothetical protein
MDIISLISNALGAVKEWFGFQSKKLDLKNSASIQAAAQQQAEIKAVEKTEQAIATGNVNEIRNEISE